MAKKIVRVVGHKNPDTDSIVAAIAYAIAAQIESVSGFLCPTTLTIFFAMYYSSLCYIFTTVLLLVFRFIYVNVKIWCNFLIENCTTHIIITIY